VKIRKHIVGDRNSCLKLPGGDNENAA